MDFKSHILIAQNVHWSPKTSHLDPFVHLGKAPRGKTEGDLSLMLGASAEIRSMTVIYAGSTIGDHFQTGHHVLIREDNQIGHHVSIGSNSTLEFGNIIGDHCRIHSGCFLERVTLEEHVFIGPNVVFTDDPHPMCPEYLRCKRGAHVGAYSRIGANVTLLPGVTIGRNCLIGAGALVTTDIPDNMVAAGHPAKVIKAVSELTCEAGFFERPYIWLDQEHSS